MIFDLNSMVKKIKPHLPKLLLLAILLCSSYTINAQIIKGVVTDSLTNEKLGYVSVFYEGTTKGTTTDFSGNYSIAYDPNFKELSFSFLGYETKKVAISSKTKSINIKLVPTDIMLNEVVIKPKKERYRKKNNPAVELMEKVIASKKEFKLEDNEYYYYNKYQKMKMSLNDLTEEKLEKKLFKNLGLRADQLELSPTTGLYILPMSIQETSSRVVYRRSPKTTKTYVDGVSTTGIQNFIATGEAFSQRIEEVFTDINIYDNSIKLLNRRFVSPIGDNALTFYKYYIMDTISVKNNDYIHLSFVPQNSQDFGFTGHLYITNDSTYAVKRCLMNLPKNTAVNFVSNLDITQDFEQLENGRWILSEDIMDVELFLLKKVQGANIQRTTQYTNFSFKELPDELFKPKGDIIKARNMYNQPDEFWQEARVDSLSVVEGSMDSFMDRIAGASSFKYVLFATKILTENYIETTKRGKRSKFDIGPVKSLISSNYLDGTRIRLGGKTTAALHPKIFVQGYGAYGFKDNKWKYSGNVIYSFKRCDNFPWEYPMHNIGLTHTYDVVSPMDKFLTRDKDNLFVSWKAFPVDQMSYIRETKVDYNFETYGGLSIKAFGRHRNDQAAGKLEYIKNDGNQTKINDITTSELGITLRYAPNETFVNTKQERKAINKDAPVFTLSHMLGMKGVLSGDYNFNFTEASAWKRFWFNSWGKLDVLIRGGVQWNTVPFPLLIVPAANLSYFAQNDETFNLMHNMEFLNDRYALLSLTYDMNGKLLNRIPLIKKLKWREVFKLKTMYGALTDKNNPFISDNPDLFLFPTRDGEYTTHVMQRNKPYIEASVGIYNIFKVLHVEYIRRLTYTDLPGTKKNGVRFTFQLTF